MKKSIFYSKTFIFNVAIGLIAVYELITGDLLTAFGVPAELQPRVMEIFGFVVALANIYLRSKTTQPVTYKKKKDDLTLGN